MWERLQATLLRHYDDNFKCNFNNIAPLGHQVVHDALVAVALARCAIQTTSPQVYNPALRASIDKFAL